MSKLDHWICRLFGPHWLVPKCSVGDLRLGLEVNAECRLCGYVTKIKIGEGAEK